MICSLNMTAGPVGELIKGVQGGGCPEEQNMTKSRLEDQIPYLLTLWRPNTGLKLVCMKTEDTPFKAYYCPMSEYQITLHPLSIVTCKLYRKLKLYYYTFE